jgi:diguanylate cyclase (GGDEF)-like protein
MYIARTIGVRLKILIAFAGAAVTISLFTGAVIHLQLSAVERGAQLEARHLATAVAYGATLGKGSLQQYVEGLDHLYKRDIVIVNAHKTGIADADIAELGRTYAGDRGNEVGLTINDGLSRRFVERNPGQPEGTEQVTVPLYEDGRVDAPIIGAVILEYTGIRRELLAETLWQIYAVGVFGLGSVLLVGWFGWRLGGSISRRLKQLQLGVQRMTEGQYDARLAIATNDEIGALTLAFNRMTDDLESSRDKLRVEIQKERAAAVQIEHLAYHDKLTGLANRSMFSKTLEQGLKEAQRYKRQLAVFFIDLDRFKNINDTLGHEAGDILLQEMATRLTSCMRASDSVARLGGDEFVVMAPSLNGTEQLGVVAQKILDSVARSFTLYDHEFHVTASIGISVYPTDGDDERALMKNADIAMYQAKEDGKNTFAFYSAELNKHSVERLAFESSLRHALEDQQFQVHYQPKVDCHTGRMTGVEALLRWNHPDLGPVSPAKFIPVAEENGLIIPIGRWVLETACLQQVMWRELGHEPLRMAVNLSARQFYDDHLLTDVASILSATGMDPTFLELEITESMLMRNVAKAIEVLAAFKKLGARLSLDDFGTGYSSLSNLKRFPIDTIKVDRSFVRELPANEEDKAITDAVIAMGRTLNMTVVAEGVETQGQIDFLREHACDEVQGFYFSKAVSSAAITALLSAQPWANPQGAESGWGVGREYVDSAFVLAV